MHSVIGGWRGETAQVICKFCPVSPRCKEAYLAASEPAQLPLVLVVQVLGGSRWG